MMLLSLVRTVVELTQVIKRSYIDRLNMYLRQHIPLIIFLLALFTVWGCSSDNSGNEGANIGKTEQAKRLDSASAPLYAAQNAGARFFRRARQWGILSAFRSKGESGTYEYLGDLVCTLP